MGNENGILKLRQCWQCSSVWPMWNAGDVCPECERANLKLIEAEEDKDKEAENE